MSRRAILVGGGPAGLACGLTLARAGIEVTVLEGAAGFRNRPGGEGVLPPGVRELEKLGVLGRLCASGSSPFSGISYWMDGAEAAFADFDEPGLGLRRPELEQALASLFQEAGGHLVFGSPVTGLIWRAGAVSGVTAGGRQWMADVVVGADGLDSTVRRLLGAVRRSYLPRRFGVCGHFEWELPRAPLERVEVHLVEGGELYRTPRGAGQEGWIFLTDEPTVRGWAGRMQESMLERVRRSPPLALASEGARLVGRVAAVGPLHRPVAFAARPGVLLIGDAAGFLDALTGEGLALGLRMASSAAQLLLESGCRVGPSEMARHELAWSAATAHPWALTRILLFLVRHRALGRLALGRMRRNPDLMARLLAVNCGEASLLGFTPVECFRLITGHR